MCPRPTRPRRRPVVFLKGRATTDNVAHDGVRADVDPDGVPEGEFEEGGGEEEDGEAEAGNQDFQGPSGGNVSNVT